MSKREQSKQRLLEAGLNVFSRYGYLGATTRTIAQEAQTNISVIAYHFGNKEGLYHAVIESFISDITEQLGPVVFHLGLLLNESHPKSYYQDKLILLLSNITLATLDPVTKKIGSIMIQEQINPSAAADIIFERYTSQMLGLVKLLLAKITDLSEDESTILAQCLIGEALMFNIMNVNLTRMLEVTKIGEKQVQLLQKIIAKQVKSYLTEES
ncbi:CerR family C-terminal domain-containing protein [Dongshaea marina]|uniref:CerR family C-terminal domain-containing protein n=1 Tax=Dongshaea marina TaxID=2047966 RepID=UPI00131F0A64|nr:CerR family C-terminal domain-containing protein [Dongshaea marina]